MNKTMKFPYKSVILLDLYHQFWDCAAGYFRVAGGPKLFFAGGTTRPPYGLNRFKKQPLTVFTSPTITGVTKAVLEFRQNGFINGANTEKIVNVITVNQKTVSLILSSDFKFRKPCPCAFQCHVVHNGLNIQNF